MRQHLRVLLFGTAMLAGSSALALAQPGPGSSDRGYGYHHGGMDGPRSPMMSPRQGYDEDYGRTNQRGYGASPYHGQHPGYHSSPRYDSDDRSWDQPDRQDRRRGHAHRSHHYDDYGRGGHGHHWDRQRGPHSRSGHAHHHGDYGPQGRGDWPHHDHHHADHHGDYQGARQDGDRWDRHSHMRDRRTRDAMGFHGMRIDTNDDGVISPDEAAAHAEMIFVLLDRNMDGVLSRDDRGKRAKSGDRDRRGTEQRGQARDDQQRGQSEASDNQGPAQESQGRGDRQTSGQEDQRPSQRGQAFRDMDQDDDGEVTMEEFMSYHEERYNELAGDEGEVSPWRYRASWHGFSSDD